MRSEYLYDATDNTNQQDSLVHRLTALAGASTSEEARKAAAFLEDTTAVNKFSQPHNKPYSGFETIDLTDDPSMQELSSVRKDFGPMYGMSQQESLVYARKARAKEWKEAHPWIAFVPDQMTEDELKQYNEAYGSAPDSNAMAPGTEQGPIVLPSRGTARSRAFREMHPEVGSVPPSLTHEELAQLEVQKHGVIPHPMTTSNGNMRGKSAQAHIDTANRFKAQHPQVPNVPYKMTRNEAAALRRKHGLA